MPGEFIIPEEVVQQLNYKIATNRGGSLSQSHQDRGKSFRKEGDITDTIISLVADDREEQELTKPKSAINWVEIALDLNRKLVLTQTALAQAEARAAGAEETAASLETEAVIARQQAEAAERANGILSSQVRNLQVENRTLRRKLTGLQAGGKQESGAKPTAIPTEFATLGINPDFYRSLPLQGRRRFLDATYRALSLTFHPDVAGASSTEKMTQLNLAYESLKGQLPR